MRIEYSAEAPWRWVFSVAWTHFEASIGLIFPCRTLQNRPQLKRPRLMPRRRIPTLCKVLVRATIRHQPARPTGPSLKRTRRQKKTMKTQMEKTRSAARYRTAEIETPESKRIFPFSLSTILVCCLTQWHTTSWKLDWYHRTVWNSKGPLYFALREITYNKQDFGNGVAVGHHCSVWKANARPNDRKPLAIVWPLLRIGPLTPLGFLKYPRQDCAIHPS